MNIQLNTYIFRTLYYFQLLQVVLNQQHETEFLVNKIQQQKDNEKNKLIKDVLEGKLS